MLLRRKTDKIDMLKRIPLFRDLNQRQLDQIARHADEIDCKADRILMRQGEMGNEVLVIVDGRARVERDGKVIAHAEAGDVVGEISLIDGKPRTASVIAETPCTLLTIHRRSFSPLLETVPGLAQKLLTTLCERLRNAENRYI